MKSLIPALIVFAILPLGACQSSEMGSGVNTVDREYSRSAADLCKAVQQCSDSTEFKTLSFKHDQLGGELVASRVNGQEVRIFVKSLDENKSRVLVSLDPSDRDLAALLHERIAANLGMGAAMIGWWSGGNSIDAIYGPDLDACMTSARRTIASLTQNQKDEECHPTWCQIDGRLKDSTPVRIKMERIENKKTRVCFIVGSAKSDDNRGFAQKMKDEFETTTPLAGSQ